MSSLPPPRLLLTTHDVDTGKQTITDQPVEMVTRHHGIAFGQAFTQGTFVGEPSEAKDGVTFKPDMTFLHSQGASFSFLDLPPKTEQPLHYATMYAYALIVSGSADIKYQDDVVKTVKQGDFVIHPACVHSWNNPYPEPCRLFGISLPSKPTMVGGQTLQEKFGVAKTF